MIDLLADLRPFVVAALAALLAAVTAAHVVLYKRDARAAVGWVGVVVLFPILGPVLYAIFGINRIKRLATELRQERRRRLEASTAEVRIEHERMEALLPAGTEHLVALGKLVDRVTHIPVTSGNRVTPLVTGDEAFPNMIQAIDGSETSVALCSYIFDYDDAGKQFADALIRAHERGVEVRVLIDGVGAFYSTPSMVRELEARGVKVARFLHSWFPWRMPFLNLRTHRKILVIDGRIGFTGGMNIREGHLLERSPKSPIRDIHFRFEGPVVAHLMRVFAEDWVFTTRETLREDTWFPDIVPDGPVAARGIADGPDEDIDKMMWVMLGAVARAHDRIRIVTPYFLPDATLIMSLNVAAMRGVQVEIVLPERTNIPLVQWASDAQLWQLLARGCRVFRTPAPFDHSKLMVVDGAWTLVGSANWDPRSLRLNFEFNVECYEQALAQAVHGLIDERISQGKEVTTAHLDARSLPVKLRDGAFRLLMPYL